MVWLPTSKGSRVVTKVRRECYGVASGAAKGLQDMPGPRARVNAPPQAGATPTSRSARSVLDGAKSPPETAKSLPEATKPLSEIAKEAPASAKCMSGPAKHAPETANPVPSRAGIASAAAEGTP